MNKTIADISSTEFKAYLKRLTGLDFIFSDEGPENSKYTLKASNTEQLETICIQWVVRIKNGILIISEPLTRRSYWGMPEGINLRDYEREEYEQAIADDFTYFMESIEQSAYMESNKFGVQIKIEKSNDPCAYVFLNNTKSENDFVNAINALEEILPQNSLAI